MNQHGEATRVLDTGSVPAEEIAARAVASLAAGGLVAVPTDTVYGLAANAALDSTVRRLFALKQRPADKPLPILIADVGELDEVAAEISPVAHKLAEHFWPGPLTLVLRKCVAISDLVSAGRPTVGVRVPDHDLTRDILRGADFPVAVTSANPSGDAEAAAPGDVLTGLGGAIDMLIDDGRCPGGHPSTVLDVTCSPPRILRPGLISWPDIEAVIGRDKNVAPTIG